ncbi:MAG: hypothetical protein ABIZ04_13965 [Opitutus sp.]
MKSLLSAVALVLFSLPASAQVLVGNTDLNKSVTTFDLYAFKKPFNTKECYFVNFGQKDFKLHFYDHSSQSVRRADGTKFEKGEWLQMVNYLKTQGWTKTDQRTEKLGNIEGRVITFERAANK